MSAPGSPAIVRQSVPRFDAPVPLRWYAPGQLACAFPLGGLGTGFVDLNGDATLGHGSWDGDYKARVEVATGCGLALWWRTAAGAVGCRQLCAPVRLQPLPLPAMADLRLAGHWPFAEVVFLDPALPVEVSLQAWTPVIPGHADDSNLPAAFFEVALRNPGAAPVDLSAAMSWHDRGEPNLPSAEAKPGARNDWSSSGFSGVLAAGAGHSLVLAAEGPAKAISRLPRWILPGWDRQSQAVPWEVTWRPFVEGGRFSPGVPAGGASATAGAALAVARNLRLEPGASATVAFLLAWHAPALKDEHGKDLGVHYAGRYGDAAAVAADAAARRQDLAARTAAWQRRLYADSRLPEWLAEHLPNALYTYARDSLWIGDGRFSHMESMYGCPINETMVCRFYGAIATLLLWPDLERNSLRQFAALQRDDGAIPFIFGGKCGFDTPNHDLQKSLDSCQFAALVWRCVHYTGDDDFAAQLYPAVARAIDYAASLDTDGDGLVNEVSGQYFDCWHFHGHSSYVASVWLLALAAAGALARRLGRAGDAERYAGLLARGRARFEELLWAGTHYRLFRDDEQGLVSDACLVSQCIGEWFAATCGLGGLLSADRVDAAHDRILACNAKLSPLGIVNASTPEGDGPDMTGYNGFSCTITIGDTYALADHLVRLGRRRDGLAQAERLVRSVAETARSPWGQTWNCSARDGRMLLMTDYYSNLVVWSLYQALTGDTRVVGR